MGDNEKIYLQEDDVTVSASRVILGDKNFVLRNIAAVQTERLKQTLLGQLYCAICLLLGIAVIMMDYPILGFIFIVGGLLCLLFKDKYYVQVSSGGTPTNTIKSDTIEFPQKVVEAINSALLDLEKISSTGKDKDESGGGKSATEELKEMKELLDSGIITQEEFDTKKRNY